MLRGTRCEARSNRSSASASRPEVFKRTPCWKRSRACFMSSVGTPQSVLCALTQGWPPATAGPAFLSAATVEIANNAQTAAAEMLRVIMVAVIVEGAPALFYDEREVIGA